MNGPALDNDHRIFGHPRRLPNCPRCRSEVLAEHEAGEHAEDIDLDCGLCENEAVELGMGRHFR